MKTLLHMHRYARHYEAPFEGNRALCVGSLGSDVVASQWIASEPRQCASCGQYFALMFPDVDNTLLLRCPWCHADAEKSGLAATERCSVCAAMWTESRSRSEEELHRLTALERLRRWQRLFKRRA